MTTRPVFVVVRTLGFSGATASATFGFAAAFLVGVFFAGAAAFFAAGFLAAAAFGFAAGAFLAGAALAGAAVFFAGAFFAAVLAAAGFCSSTLALAGDEVFFSAAEPGLLSFTGPDAPFGCRKVPLVTPDAMALEMWLV